MRRLRHVSGRRGALLVGVLACMLGAAASPASAQILLAEFGDESAGEGDIGQFPGDVVTDADGNVWVSDPANARLAKFDYNGSFIASVGAPQLQQPRGLGADGDSVYVAEGRTGSVIRFDLGGRVIEQLGVRAPIDLNNPQDVAVSPEGVVHVSDAGTGQIVRFRPDGGVQRSLDIAAGKLGFDGEGRLYAESGAFVRRYSASGSVEQTFVSGLVGSVAGFAVTPDGILHVADGSGTLRLFDLDGRALGSLLAPGTGPGELTAPNGVAADCRGNVYVVDTRNLRREDGTFDAIESQGKVVKIGDPAAPPPPCGPPRALPDRGFAARALDIEITQGVQLDGPGSPQPRTQVYGKRRPEVGLAEGKRTVVRFYAGLSSGPPGGLANVPAILQGSKRVGGRTIGLGTLLPDASPAVLRPGLEAIGTAQRTDPAAAYTFTLPPEWTEGTVSLTARVNPAGIGCRDSACRDQSEMRLIGIPFRKTFRLDVLPLALTINGARPPLDPADAFDDARNLSPLPIDVRPYGAIIEIGDLTSAATRVVTDCFLDIELDPLCDEEVVALTRSDREALVATRIAAWAAGAGLSPDVLPFGLIDRDGRGAPIDGAGYGDIGDVIGVQRGDIGRAGATAHGEVGRPRSIIAHELFHAVGLPHAGTHADCYPDARQRGEDWPADQRGYTQALGLDSRPASGGGRGPYRILAPGLPNGPAQWHDLMSYCANSADDATSTSASDAWLSARNWDRILAFRQPAGRSAAASARQGSDARTARVDAAVLSDGRIAIVAVQPGAARPGAEPSAAYTVESRAADGDVIARAPLREQTIEVVRGAPATILDGAVPVAGAASVTLSRDGVPVTSRSRSANPPKVAVLAPRRGSRPRGETVEVRWRASDPDGDTLTASVDLSLDGGRTWRTLTTQTPGSRVRVPSGLLPASRRARVRVRVNDGFDEASATSGVFRSPGARPLVRILDPVAGRPVAADARVLLRGEAVDDRGRALRGRALTWRVGRRVIGRGAAASAAGLAPGRRTIVLEARDRSGRTARESVPIAVRGVRPAFLRLDRPARVGRARRVALRVATNVTARLRVGRTRARVGRRARVVRVAVPRGSGPVTLRLALRAGGRTLRETVTIPR